MSDEATVLYRPDRPAVVKPSREEIARKVCSCGQPEFHDPNQSVECDWTLACVSAVLALLPGRSEREVLAQGWDEGAYEGWRLYSESFETVKERNPYRTDDRQEADRNG